MITAEGYEGFFGNDNEVLGFPFFLWFVSMGQGGKSAGDCNGSTRIGACRSRFPKTRHIFIKSMEMFSKKLLNLLEAGLPFGKQDVFSL